MPKKVSTGEILKLKHVVSLYAFLLVVWGFYRALFKFPDEVEELILKPILWLGPMFYYLARERASLSAVGWHGRNLFRSVYLAVGLGTIFVFVAYGSNIFKYGQTNFADFGLVGNALWGALGVSVVTAITEETVFRGYIFGRLSKILSSELVANLMQTVGWAVIHLPVLILVHNLGSQDLGVRLVLTSILGFGSAFLYARTGNIISSVLLHVFWSWPILLFR